MAKKKVSVKRPEGSTTSVLTFMLDDKRVTLDFNQQGIAKVEESISKAVLKKFAALTLINQSEDSTNQSEDSTKESEE